MTNEESICHRAFSAMVDNVEALSLVRECRELEERYKSNFTSEILNSNEPADRLDIIRNAQKIINKKDQLLLLQKVSKYQFVHKIAECVGWKKLWDHALDHGPSVIKGMKNLVRVITYPANVLCAIELTWTNQLWPNMSSPITRKVTTPGALSLTL